MPHPLFVVCDRCRAEGRAGEDPFAGFGDLLDFVPVPRRKNRADGWDAEVQRAFVAALSLTGSHRQAARAVGKSPFGVTQLLACPGSEGFAAACDEAMAIAADERSRRLAEGLRAVAAEQAGWRPPPPPWSRAGSGARSLPAPCEPVLSEAEQAQAAALRNELLAVIVRKYVLKLEDERRCRLAGRIAEADFCIRQVTMLEVALDMVSGDGMAILKEVRLGGFDLLAVAETDMSRRLDEARRAHWTACGDPPRPEYPPRHLLVEQEGFATQPLEATYGVDGDWRAQERKRQAYDEQHAKDAEAQVAWEAQARRDYEEGRASDASS